MVSCYVHKLTLLCTRYYADSTRTSGNLISLEVSKTVSVHKRECCIGILYPSQGNDPSSPRDVIALRVPSHDSPGDVVIVEY